MFKIVLLIFVWSEVYTQDLDLSNVANIGFYYANKYGGNYGSNAKPNQKINKYGPPIPYVDYIPQGIPYVSDGNGFNFNKYIPNTSPTFSNQNYGNQFRPSPNRPENGGNFRPGQAGGSNRPFDEYSGYGRPGYGRPDYGRPGFRPQPGNRPQNNDDYYVVVIEEDTAGNTNIPNERPNRPQIVVVEEDTAGNSNLPSVRPNIPQPIPTAPPVIPVYTQSPPAERPVYTQSPPPERPVYTQSPPPERPVTQTSPTVAPAPVPVAPTAPPTQLPEDEAFDIDVRFKGDQ